MSIRAIMKSDLAELAKLDHERFLKIDPDFDVPVGSEWWTNTADELLEYFDRGKTGGGVVDIGPKGIRGGIVMTTEGATIDVVAVIREEKHEEEVLFALFRYLRDRLERSKKRDTIRVHVPDGDDTLLSFLQKARFEVSLVPNHYRDKDGRQRDAWACSKRIPATISG